MKIFLDCKEFHSTNPLICQLCKCNNKKMIIKNQSYSFLDTITSKLISEKRLQRMPHEKKNELHKYDMRDVFR